MLLECVGDVGGGGCEVAEGLGERYQRVSEVVSVQKREWTNKDGKRQRAYRVRWQDGDVWKSETFERKKDADDFDADVRHRKSLGTLAELQTRTQTLDVYVADVFTPTHASQLATKTQKLSAGLYDSHISPYVVPMSCP